MKKLSFSALLIISAWCSQLQAQLFVMTDSLPLPHINQQSQKLNNGMVLTFGGEDGEDFDPNNTYSSAYLYNNRVWTPTGSMLSPRTQFASVLLPNGKVLAMGGIAVDENYEWASCEIYDPSTGQWTYTDSLPSPSYIDGAVVLNNGKVLEADGDSSHIYDPSTGKWDSVAPMAAPHGTGPAVALLQNGDVLAVGGNDCTNCADVYNHLTNSWSVTANQTTYSRSLTTAITLNNGKVLVFGSIAVDSGQNTSELFDPATDSFTVTGNLLSNVSSSPAVLLDNGNPLVWSFGNLFGIGDSSYLIQIYNIATGQWFAPPSDYLGTTNNTIVKMSNNEVLVIAGGELGQPVPYCWLINGDVAGIKETTPSGDFSLWPNPGNRYFRVGGASTPAPELIRIYDIEGRMLNEIKQNPGQAVNTANLAPGSYIIALFYADGTPAGVQKWVKL